MLWIAVRQADLPKLAASAPTTPALPAKRRRHPTQIQQKPATVTISSASSDSHTRDRGVSRMSEHDEFDEQFYVRTNQDVEDAVRNKQYSSGHEHYQRRGRNEGRAGTAAARVAQLIDFNAAGRRATAAPHLEHGGPSVPGAGAQPDSRVLQRPAARRGHLEVGSLLRCVPSALQPVSRPGGSHPGDRHLQRRQPRALARILRSGRTHLRRRYRAGL